MAVTLLVAAYAGATGLQPGRIALVTAAVLTGQLSIGWSNDLVDRDRDRSVARADKPLATGELPVRTARVACAVAAAATVVLSLACGLLAGVVHLTGVACGWAYNAGLKSTVLSWLPYAVAFGGLPVFVVLADPGAGLPPAWLPAAGALLGVGAHLLNALPDLGDDRATGVSGLPHRLGERWTPPLAVAVLAGATAVIALGAAVPGPALAALLPVTAGLAGLALLTRGRTPFRAAIGIAVVAVALLGVAR